MKNGMSVALPMMASILLGFGTFSCNSTKPAGETTSADASTKTQPATQPNLDKQRQQAEQQARPGIEKERKKGGGRSREKSGSGRHDGNIRDAKRDRRHRLQ